MPLLVVGSIALDMLKRGALLAPLAIGIAAVAGGGDVAASVAYGIAIVLANLALSAVMLGWAAKQTPTILMMVAHLYARREAASDVQLSEVPMAFEMLLASESITGRY